MQLRGRLNDEGLSGDGLGREVSAEASDRSRKGRGPRRARPLLLTVVAAVGLCAAARFPSADAAAQPGPAAPSAAAGSRRPGETTADELPAQTVEALAYADRLAAEQRTSSNEFLAAMQKALAAFSVVEPGLEPGKSVMQTFTLNTEGAGIDGLILPVPEGQQRDLFWAFVNPPRALRSWYIMPAAGSTSWPGFRRYWPFEDFRLKGVDLAPNSEMVLQASVARRGQPGLVPGQKYILWFNFDSDKPVEFHVATCLPPRGSGVDTAPSIARMVGLTFASIIDACELGLVDQASDILDADPAAIGERTRDGETPLHCAIEFGQVEAATLLVARGADLNAKSNSGATPLHVAVLEQSDAGVKLLVDHGADLSVKNAEGLTPLHLAAQVGYVAAIAPLLAGGADVNARTDDGRTALHVAAQEGQVQVAEQLLANGATLEATDARGRTPLHAAAGRGQDDMIAFLVARGAAIDARDKEGQTPIKVAWDAGYEDTVQVLARLGASDVPAPSEWVDLLKLVNPTRDAVAGTWTLRNGALASDWTGAARISFPYEVPDEYDFSIDFTVSRPDGCTAQLLCRGKAAFTWNMNAGSDPHCRLEDINGHATIGNPTLKRYRFEPGVRYVSLVRVRKGSVTCLINGEVIAEHKTDYSDLSRNEAWRMPNELRLGVGTSNGPTIFNRIAVRPIREQAANPEPAG